MPGRAWHFLAPQADFFGGGLCRGFFCPRRAEPNGRGQFLSGTAEMGGSPPFDSAALGKKLAP